MAVTPQTQAIQNKNSIEQLCARLLQLTYDIQTVNSAYIDDASGNTLNAMATAPLNTDGTLGTADSTPNSTHAIDTRIYTAVQRATSAFSTVQALTVLNNIPLYVNGSSVSATTGVRAILNAATGG